ncbi:hypothetical protein NRI_0031 [Neorickettsia risticii str. Illinois]|uniref:Uncharacterized protein n=1 Tax=Neorickettsia risticii (strain Illinois) TaxID=434131 RepID=C6V3R3_NEORI|nr:hypothetical protein NRI_0031 [Neorickettsia risticii str. Illinois]
MLIGIFTVADKKDFTGHNKNSLRKCAMLEHNQWKCLCSHFTTMQ